MEELKSKKQLFWACFIALTATSFIFMLRAMFITEWGHEFNLSKTQMGEILGVGLWPFAVTIVLFSLIVDRIGFGRSMIFAFTCHIVSTVLIIFANGYWMLYTGTLIMALGNGIVEAVINPVVATLFPNEKTKWLNILHAGWPGGMVLGGILAIIIGTGIQWQYKMSLIFIPTLIYGFLMVRKKFPVSERVKAGVSYIDMLKEVGIVGILIITSLLVFQIGGLFSISLITKIIIIVAITTIFGYYVRSFGQPLFIILLIIILPLATTELATDSWLPELMESEMQKLGIQAAWILVYTAAVMTVMRFSAGFFVKKLNPVGLLALCSLVAVIGLVFLSSAIGFVILIAATIYGMAKSYLYPTMIGIVGERFPKGGALTLNLVIGVGLVGTGILGAPFFGYIQDTAVERKVIIFDNQNNTAYRSNYITGEKSSLFGKYRAIDNAKLDNAPQKEKTSIFKIQSDAKKGALKTIAFLPAFMFICYIGLLIYFRSKGGYKTIDIHHST